MKKVTILAFGILSAFLITKSATAATADEAFIIECEKNEVTVSQSTKCTLYSSSSYVIAAVELDITKPDDLSLSNFVVSSDWQGDIVGNNLLLYTDVNKTEKTELLSFDASSNKIGDYAININNALFTDASFTRNNVYGATYTISFVEEKHDDKPDITPDDDGKKDDIVNPDTNEILPIALFVIFSSICAYGFIRVRRIRTHK